MKLIVEMEMKNRCIDCQVRLSCKRYIEALQTSDGIEKMRKKIGSYDCLIKGKLPDEHGDLIDRGELIKSVNGVSTHWLNEWSTLGVLSMIDKQPTVIAAERKDDGIKQI